MKGYPIFKDPEEKYFKYRKNTKVIITHRMFGDIHCRIVSARRPMVNIVVLQDGYFPYGSKLYLNFGNILNCT